ncbi:MAG: hypothetical protein OEY31_01750 [Candidatus Bathyarchaeota archaeon]|nr:hypothetical protein [Candidatus Bathyarchaeota archaeon]
MVSGPNKDAVFDLNFHHCTASQTFHFALKVTVSAIWYVNNSSALFI